jgi:hypothetical protein
MLNKYQIKKVLLVGHQLLMPVILATWKAEIRRIAVRGLPSQKVSKTPCQPIVGGHSGMSLSSQAIQKARIRRIVFPGWSGQNIMPYLQNNQSKKGCK